MRKKSKNSCLRNVRIFINAIPTIKWVRRVERTSTDNLWRNQHRRTRVVKSRTTCSLVPIEGILCPSYNSSKMRTAWERCSKWGASLTPCSSRFWNQGTFGDIWSIVNIILTRFTSMPTKRRCTRWMRKPYLRLISFGVVHTKTCSMRPLSNRNPSKTTYRTN